MTEGAIIAYRLCCFLSIGAAIMAGFGFIVTGISRLALWILVLTMLIAGSYAVAVHPLIPPAMQFGSNPSPAQPQQ